MKGGCGTVVFIVFLEGTNTPNFRIFVNKKKTR